MNENGKRLLEMVKENPELPVVPMVDAEICGDNYGVYMGGWGAARIDEYIITDNDEMVIFKSDNDVFDALERCLTKEEFEALPETKAECRSAYNALPWKKAIIVDITTAPET